MSNATLSQHLARLTCAKPQPVRMFLNLIFMIKTFYDKKHVAITQFSYGRCIKLGYVKSIWFFNYEHRLIICPSNEFSQSNS